MVDVFIYKALTVLMAYMELILWMKFLICNQQHYYMVQSSSSVKIAAYLCSICMLNDFRVVIRKLCAYENCAKFPFT